MPSNGDGLIRPALTRFRPELFDRGTDGRPQFDQTESAMRAVRQQQHLFELRKHVIRRINSGYNLADGVRWSVEVDFAVVNGGQFLALHNLYLD
jgi:hypothetical protein